MKIFFQKHHKLLLKLLFLLSMYPCFLLLTLIQFNMMVLTLSIMIHLGLSLFYYKLPLKKVLVYTGFLFILSIIYRIFLIKYGSPFLLMLAIFLLIGHFPVVIVSIEFLLQQSFLTLFFGFNIGVLFLSLRLLFFGDLLLMVSVMERYASTHRFMILLELNATTLDQIKPKTKTFLELWKEMPPNVQKILLATQKPGYSHFVSAVKQELIQPKPMKDLFREDWLMRGSARLYFTQFHKFYLNYHRFRNEPITNSIYIPEKNYKPTPQDTFMALWMSGCYPGHNYTFTLKFLHEFLHKLRFSPLEGWPTPPALEYRGDFYLPEKTSLSLIEFKTQIYDMYTAYKRTVSEKDYYDVEEFSHFARKKSPFILGVKEKALQNPNWKRNANIEILILRDGGLLKEVIELPLVDAFRQNDIRKIKIYGTGNLSLYDKFNPEEVNKFLTEKKLTIAPLVIQYSADRYNEIELQIKQK